MCEYMTIYEMRKVEKGRKVTTRNIRLTKLKWKVQYFTPENTLLSERYFRSIPKMSQFYENITKEKLTRIWLGLHKASEFGPHNQTSNQEWKLRRICRARNNDAEFF